MLAPVVLFVYNRPEHTRKTLEALSANREAAETDLYIFSDGPKSNASSDDFDSITAVRRIINNVAGFNTVSIQERAENVGLAKSIISGVTEIINQYTKVIVLEDDLVLSKSFLQYMNTALEKYAESKEVMQISGYMYPLSRKIKEKSFFIPVTNSWGWGTWQRAWRLFDGSAKGYENLKNDKRLRQRFNLDNSFDFSEMLIQQMETNNINSWAIRFYWSVFEAGGLVLYPYTSLVKNMGWDGSGVHAGKVNPFEISNFEEKEILFKYPPEIKINSYYFKAVKEYLRNNSFYAKHRINITQLPMKLIKKVFSRIKR